MKICRDAETAVVLTNDSEQDRGNVERCEIGSHASHEWYSQDEVGIELAEILVTVTSGHR